MGTKTIKVDGTAFKIGKNVKVNGVTCKGAAVQWRMHKTLARTVELRKALQGKVVVQYDIVEPVPVAAYFPFIIKKKKVT